MVVMITFVSRQLAIALHVARFARHERAVGFGSGILAAPGELLVQGPRAFLSTGERLPVIVEGGQRDQVDALAPIQKVDGGIADERQPVVRVSNDHQRAIGAGRRHRRGRPADPELPCDQSRRQQTRGPLVSFIIITPAAGTQPGRCGEHHALPVRSGEEHRRGVLTGSAGREEAFDPARPLGGGPLRSGSCSARCHEHPIPSSGAHASGSRHVDGGRSRERSRARVRPCPGSRPER